MPTIKAHYDGRAIVPDQPVEWTPRQPLVVHFEPAPAAAPPRSSSKHFLDWVVENLVADSGHTDGGTQRDHLSLWHPEAGAEAGMSIGPPVSRDTSFWISLIEHKYRS